MNEKDKKKFKKAKVIIGVPTTRNYVNMETAYSLLSMAKPNFGLAVVNDIPTDIARNMIVKKALAMKEVTHIFFADSDMIYPATTLVQLIVDDLPIVSGLAYQRKPPFAPVIINRIEMNGVLMNKWFLLTPQDQLKGLISCDATGGSCLLIRREVFDSIDPPYFKFITDNRHEQIITGEDIYFFDKVKNAGYKTHVDTRVVCGHMGDTSIVIPDIFSSGWVLPGEKTIETWKQLTNPVPPDIENETL